jgi:hypothetical protein
MTMNRQWALVNMLINPEFDKGQGTCWQAELPLASQDGLCSMAVTNVVTALAQLLH